MSQSRTFKAGILASGQFLTSCVGLISFAVLTRVLSVRDYATYRQTLLAYAFAVPLLTLGLPQALYYFLPGEQVRPRAILIENVLLLSFMGVVFCAFILLGGDRLLAWRFSNPDLARTLRMLAPYPLFMLPASALSACLVARERVKHVAIFNILSRLLMLTLVVTVSVVWRTPSAAIIGTVAGAGIVLLPALKLMLDSCDGGTWHPHLHGMWSQLKYAVPLGLAAMLAAISLSLDKVIVSSMCSPEQFAVYVNGAFEIPLITVVTGSVIAVLIPDFVKQYRSSEYGQLRALWHRAMVRCLAILLPVMGFILVMAPEIMRLLFSSKYDGSSYPFRIYSLMLPVRATTFGAVLMATNRTRAIMVGSALNLTGNGLLSILFVSLIGPAGAAWATVLSVLGLALFYCNVISKQLKLNRSSVLPWRDIAHLFLLVAVPTVVTVAVVRFVQMPPHKDILRLSLSSLVFLLVLGICYHKASILKFSQLISIAKRQFSRS